MTEEELLESTHVLLRKQIAYHEVMLKERKTLRDEFAAKAMQGIILDDGIDDIWDTWTDRNDKVVDKTSCKETMDKVAAISYTMADAMLEARNKEVTTKATKEE